MGKGSLEREQVGERGSRLGRGEQAGERSSLGRGGFLAIHPFAVFMVQATSILVIQKQFFSCQIINYFYFKIVYVLSPMYFMYQSGLCFWAA